MLCCAGRSATWVVCDSSRFSVGTAVGTAIVGGSADVEALGVSCGLLFCLSPGGGVVGLLSRVELVFAEANVSGFESEGLGVGLEEREEGGHL